MIESVTDRGDLVTEMVKGADPVRDVVRGVIDSFPAEHLLGEQIGEQTCGAVDTAATGRRTGLAIGAGVRLLRHDMDRPAGPLFRPGAPRAGPVRERRARAFGATTVGIMSAAVFDVDNTLVRGSTLYHAALALGRAGLVDLSALPRAVFEQYRFRLTANEPELDGIRRRALSAIEGLPVARLEEALAGLGDRILARAMFPGSLALVNRHLERGEEVWLATAGPAELARQIAARLGLTGAIGTEVEVRDGHCTGSLDGPLLHGRAKADAVTSLGEQRGWDLNRVSTYSDSSRDLPLLRCAGLPNAVNPDRRLRRLATAEGWPVHDTAPKRETAPLLAAGGVLLAARLLRSRSR